MYLLHKRISRTWWNGNIKNIIKWARGLWHLIPLMKISSTSSHIASTGLIFPNWQQIRLMNMRRLEAKGFRARWRNQWRIPKRQTKGAEVFFGHQISSKKYWIKKHNSRNFVFLRLIYDSAHPLENFWVCHSKEYLLISGELTFIKNVSSAFF